MSVKSATKMGARLLVAPLALSAAVSSIAHAEEIKVKIPDTTLTASLRTSFVSTTSDDSTVMDVADFALNSFSIYMNSKITENIKFSFSSEFSGPTTNNVQVQDAIAQFEYSPTMNIWAGRFLPPTDRANSYGAYFANNWNFAVDGTQDGYEFIAFGRADGVAYWGDFMDTKLKISAGLFDVPRTLGLNDTMAAARVQLDLWDAEPGYYVNGTYLGEKDILAFAVAANAVDSKNTTSFDFLMEKKVGDGGAFSLEAEYIKYDELGGYPLPGQNGDPSVTTTLAGGYTTGDSWYAMAAYLLPQPVGPGKLQFLGKFGTTTYDGALTNGTDLEQDTTEVNINYILKGFNTRFSLFYLGKAYSADAAADTDSVGLGVQLMTL
ncbi:MAG: phosphate-selective porin [Moraxellaceae bacterium]|nr:phosphate-selective porin [Moraxellaceae bacterium]